jgi:hypothetical protein
LSMDIDRASTWPEAYQVLLRIGDIHHSPRTGSIGKQLTLVSATRISESESWWADWGVRLNPELTSWLGE